MAAVQLRMGCMSLITHVGLTALTVALLPSCASTGSFALAAEEIEALTETGEDSSYGDYSSDASYVHLPIGLKESGISIGNSRRWNGLRLNVSDHAVEEVNGINLGVWDFHKPAVERMRGIDLGLKNRVVEGRGLSLGLIGIEGEVELRGVHVSGLGTVSEGDIGGLGLGGLAVVAGEDLYGIHAGGLAVVSQGEQRGLTLGGLAVVSQEAQSGIQVGGLAVVSQGAQRGLGLGGLAVVSQEDQLGIRAGGLAVVSGANLSGLSMAGLACVSGADLRGVALSGIATIAVGDIDGVAGALLSTHSRNLDGVAFSGYNRIDGHQTGLSIGIFNRTRSLHGVQIGLLNYVKENPAWLRWLPIVNARF